MTSTEFRMPTPPLGGAALTVARWLKRPGEWLAAGEPLLVAVNDRVELLLPSAGAGVLERVVAEQGAQVQAGALIATLAPAAPQPDESLAASPDATTSRTLRPPRASPVARRIALTHEIDIMNMLGSGPTGRIMKRDVLAVMRNTATVSTDAWATSDITIDTQHGHFGDSKPQLSILHTGETYALTAMEVDLSRVTTARARGGPEPWAFVACAAARALLDHPLLNGAWAEDHLLLRRRVHLALADPSGAWKIVRDAQDLNARGLARALGAAQPGGALEEATFAIVDMGGQQWWAAPAPASGRIAALGVGAIRPRAMVVAEGNVERVAARPAALLTLAYDARALDQHHADAFLSEVKRWLECSAAT